MDLGSDLAVASLVTPVGQVSVAVTPDGLAAVGWGSPRRLVERSALPEVADPDRVAPVLTQMRDYFRGQRRDFDLAIDWRLTAGQPQAVLRTLLMTVGHGETVTYGELAERSGTGIPARGIGAVMGANPIPIVVPCHRVVAHDGLGGYSGGTGGNGLAVKRWLLILEGGLPPTLDWDPTRLTG